MPFLDQIKLQFLKARAGVIETFPESCPGRGGLISLWLAISFLPPPHPELETACLPPPHSLILKAVIKWDSPKDKRPRNLPIVNPSFARA